MRQLAAAFVSEPRPADLMAGRACFAGRCQGASERAVSARLDSHTIRSDTIAHAGLLLTACCGVTCYEVAESLQQGATCLLRFCNAGMISAPFGFTSEHVQKFEKLKEASSHFEEVVYDSKNKTLFLHLSALSYHARMTLRVSVKEVMKGRANEILWESIDGHFKGMKGVIHLEDYQKRKTEMSLTASYKTKKLPLPKALMGIGLEMVAHTVAMRLRTHIEDKYNDR